jgi:hypothetical protein
MALTPSVVDQIAAWCATSDEITDIRSKARSEYFGYDEPGEVRYMEGASVVSQRKIYNDLATIDCKEIIEP